MKFYKFIVFSITLILSLNASSLEYGDTAADTFLVKSSQKSGDPDLITCPLVGDNSRVSGGIVINMDNETIEFIGFSGSKAATFKPYVFRDDLIVGKVTGFEQTSFDDSGDNFTANTTYNRWFAGMLNTNNRGAELRGTLNEIKTSTRTAEDDFGNGLTVKRTTTCTTVYDFSSQLSNPFVSEPTPISPSFISILLAKREYVPTKSPNTRRVRNRSTCCGLSGRRG